MPEEIEMYMPAVKIKIWWMNLHSIDLFLCECVNYCMISNVTEVMLRMHWYW